MDNIIQSAISKVKSLAQKSVNMLPPVQAYNAVKTMATPQFRQQAQSVADWGSNLSQRGANFGQQIGQRIQQTPQFKMGPIQDFKTSLIKKAAPTALGMVGSAPGEFVRGIAQLTRDVSEPSRIAQARFGTTKDIFNYNPQDPTKLGIAFNAATALPDITDIGKVALMGGLATSVLKPQLEAKALKQFLPEIRNVSKMLGNMDEIPDLTPQQVKAAEEIVAKIRGSNAVAQINKLNPNAKDYFNSLRVLLSGAEDQILNPKINIGFSTKAVKTPRAAQAGLSVPSTKGVESMPVSTKGNIGRQSDISQLETVGQILSERGNNIVPSKVGKIRTTSQARAGRVSPDKYITLGEVEKAIYGAESGIPATGTKESAGFLSDNLRKLEAGISTRVAKGLESSNSMVRWMASATQDLIGGAGKSGEQIKARGTYRGGIDYGTKLATDTQKKIYDMLGRDNESLSRVHAVLDPQISKIKVKESNLTAPEKEAVGVLRVVSDFINDTNFQLGFISKDKWKSNQGGKYIARAYEPFDYPPEVADFVKDKSIKFDLQPFKTRGEVTDWKVENAIKDPAYLMGKRLQQTMFNQEVAKYMDFAKNNNLTSDVAKDGFVQLSDSKSYGDLAGKYIRKDALEDVKGFFATNDVAQKAYDILNWYDRNPVRKAQKALKTVFNPAVRLGNQTGNFVFAWLNGINPATFTKNKVWASKAIKNNDPIYRSAIQSGIMGTDVTKADISRISAELKNGVTDRNILQKIDDWAKESYGRVDDNSKLAAFKTWIDRGYTADEAINKVRRGFQDYNMVGMLYDVGAKLPILGNPFVRFASESMRIAKNAIIDHPIRAVATVAAWKMFTDIMSRMSGETPEDKKTREERVGAAHIPFTDISFNVQTPWGEINASRLMGFSTTYTPEDATLSDLSKYSPIQNPLDVRNYGSDPMIGPLISLATDKDFRGKSIADPNANKYTGSTLTGTERNLNRAGFLARAYLPPTATDLYNIGAAVQGKENVYGQKKTPTQAILRTYPGVKVEQFGAKEAQKRREQDEYFKGIKNEQIQKQINSVYKQELKGEITKDQVIKRVNDLQKDMSDVTVKSTGEAFRYLDDNGSMQTIEKDWTPPTLTLKGMKEIDKKLVSQYKSEITSRQTDLLTLNKEGQLSDNDLFKQYMDLEKLKVTATNKVKVKKPKKIKVKVASLKFKKIKAKSGLSKMKRFKLVRAKRIK